MERMQEEGFCTAVNWIAEMGIYAHETLHPLKQRSDLSINSATYNLFE